MLAAGTDLIVVGRAGIGLDNVDVAAATERGVMVVNAPQSNTLSAAEHTMALLLSQARNVPQASRRPQGGPLGALEVDRCRAVRQDARHHRPGSHRQAGGPASAGVRHEARRLRPVRRPRTAPVSCRSSCCRSTSSWRRSDFITLHLAKTPETAGLIDAGDAGQGQAVAARRQRRPWRHHRRGGARCRGRGRDHRRCRHRRVRHRADHRVAPVRAGPGRGHPAPRRLAPPRRRTRPATPSPTWSSWRSPATSCPTR